MSETGTPTSILFANNIVLSKSLCSIKESAIDIMLNNGKAIIKPAKIGFFKDNQLANAMMRLEIRIFEIRISIFREISD